jgi:hypothetical protein
MKIEFALPSDDTSDEILKTILKRMGLAPSKVDAIGDFNRLFKELYERKKFAIKDPKNSVMSVDEMSIYAGIKRQTMYDYLNRWLEIRFLKKTCIGFNEKIGYELSGASLEASFQKVQDYFQKEMNLTGNMIHHWIELQRKGELHG